MRRDIRESIRDIKEDINKSMKGSLEEGIKGDINTSSIYPIINKDLNYDELVNEMAFWRCICTCSTIPLIMLISSCIFSNFSLDPGLCDVDI
jgi:hypothetical protein